jgi:ankyrin repeat protein
VEKDGKDYEIWKLQNPLHYAATVRGPDLASAIEANRDQLNAVDDVSKCSTVPLTDSRNPPSQQGWSPLLYAAFNGAKENIVQVCRAALGVINYPAHPTLL